MCTGYVYDSIFLQHDLRGHPENAQRLVHITRLLEETGTLARLTNVSVRDISADELQRVFRECDGVLDDMIERLEVSKHGIKLRLKECDIS